MVLIRLHLSSISPPVLPNVPRLDWVNFVLQLAHFESQRGSSITVFQRQFSPCLQAKTIRPTQLGTTGKATLSLFTLFYSTLLPETEKINIWKFKPLWFQKYQGLPASSSVQEICIKSIRASPCRKWGSNSWKSFEFYCIIPIF